MSANANASALPSSPAALVAGVYEMPSDAPRRAKDKAATQLTPAAAMTSVLERSLCHETRFLGLNGRALQLIRGYAIPSPESREEPDFDEILFGDEITRTIKTVSRRLPPDMVKRIGTYLAPPEMALFTVLQPSATVTSFTCTRMLLHATTKEFRMQAYAIGLWPCDFSEIRAWRLLMFLHGEGVSIISDGPRPPYLGLARVYWSTLSAQYLNLREFLPEGLGNLAQPEPLTFPNNRLMALPESLGNLAQPEPLTFPNNRPMALPESIRNLTRLR